MTDKAKLLGRVRMYDFALVEVIEYLDGHPDNAAALKYYNEMRAAFDKMCIRDSINTVRGLGFCVSAVRPAWQKTGSHSQCWNSVHCSAEMCIRDSLSAFLLLVAPCVGTFCITSLYVTPILYFMSHLKSSIISK